MPNRVTAITVQKRDRHRCNLFINDAYAFSIACDLVAHLHPGDRLSDAQIEALKSADRYRDAYDRALRQLGRRPRSRVEMADYLKGKGFTESVVESTLGRLESNRYIDDEAFARFWVEARERSRPRGRFALRRELRLKGVDEAIIAPLLSDRDEEESAWRAVSAKLKRWQPLDETLQKRRIYAFLKSRGFSHAICEAILQRLNRWEDADSTG